MSFKNSTFNKGFTLIEMMVALALFTIVITIASGALLSLIGANARGQGEQNIMSTMTFALDSMTREIRTGTNYYCKSDNFSNQESYGNDAVLDCVNPGTANGISFVESGSSITGSTATRIAYYFDSTNHKIMRRVGNDSTAVPLVSDGIYVKSARFYVTGTTHLNNGGDIEQPTVTIVIEASESSAATDKVFTLQTTVTQRELDL